MASVRIAWEDVVESLYAFANDELEFPTVASKIQSLLGAHSIGVTWNDAESGATTLSWPHLDPALAEPYVREFHALDPWKVANLTAPVGAVRTSDQLVPRRDLVNSRFYQELLRRGGLEDFLSVVLERSSSGSLVVGALFGERVRPTQRRAFSELVPHVRRALKLRERHHHLRLVRDALEATTRQAGLGLLLYEGGREQYRTPGAANVLATAAEHFEACLKRHFRKKPVDKSVIYRLGDPDGTVAVIFSETAASFGPSWTRALLVPGTFPKGDGLARVLQTLYGLSLAETRLCRALARGRVVKEFAAEMDVEVSTVRTQLLSVFRKTGTTRQADLVALLSRLAAIPQRF